MKTQADELKEILLAPYKEHKGKPKMCGNCTEYPVINENDPGWRKSYCSSTCCEEKFGIR